MSMAWPSRWGIVVCGAISLLTGALHAAEPSAHAIDYRRTTVYESPTTPKYTSWIGTWQMPDESLMMSTFIG